MQACTTEGSTSCGECPSQGKCTLPPSLNAGPKMPAGIFDWPAAVNEPSKSKSNGVCRAAVDACACTQLHGCGWSKNTAVCIPGSSTSCKECPSQPQCEGGGTGTTSSECFTYATQCSCSKQAGCGWSKTRGQCAAGGSTSCEECSKQDKCLGKQTDAYCSQFRTTCACTVTGCGWSNGACLAGKKTDCTECDQQPVCLQNSRCNARDPCECTGECGWSNGECKEGKKTSCQECATQTKCQADNENVGAAAARTKAGCTCKDRSELVVVDNGRVVKTYQSHQGCGTGDHEDLSPAKGQLWCDTVEAACRGGLGWDFCTKTSDKAAFLPLPVRPITRPPSPRITRPPSSSPLYRPYEPITRLPSALDRPTDPQLTRSGCTCRTESEVWFVDTSPGQDKGGFSHRYSTQGEAHTHTHMPYALRTTHTRYTKHTKHEAQPSTKHPPEKARSTPSTKHIHTYS